MADRLRITLTEHQAEVLQRKAEALKEDPSEASDRLSWSTIARRAKQSLEWLELHRRKSRSDPELKPPTSEPA